MEKTRRYEAPRKFEYNRTDKKFPASTNFNKQYEAPVTKYENVQRYQDNAQKGYYNKNYEKNPNHNATKHAQTIYSKSQKFRERPKETCTLVVKEGLRTKEIFSGKKKITALIDSGSIERNYGAGNFISLIRDNLDFSSLELVLDDVEYGIVLLNTNWEQIKNNIVMIEIERQSSVTNPIEACYKDGR
ncbi:hypothetical protein TNCT_494681 [Trichonephila clavata]|uniref:Uncharacterized protein n=1 Tax=Trichonephila clavata TaxID=2740835 RepID=A0A8X6G0B9_TRICU|nr:hypothetical protein TNCT_494681 [Trichonephila clavata]